MLTFPPPFTYAVIRMDPVTMVQDLGLDDPATLAEAKGMSPKKYLIYIEWPLELPMPNSRWCKYEINPIGTTFRPADEKRAISPDMVLPISPNTQHAHGPEPVRPSRPFPFSNCYHWYSNTLRARVRVHKEGYDESAAISMSALAITRRFEAAQKRSFALLEKRGGLSWGADSATAFVPAGLVPGSPEVQTITELYRRLAVKHGLLTSGDSGYDSDDDSDNADSSDDIFGWNTDLATALLPLVDAWLDIEEHLSEDEIPSPLDLDAEIRETIEIMKRGLLRYAASEQAASAVNPATSGGGRDDAPPPPQLRAVRVSPRSGSKQPEVPSAPPKSSAPGVRAPETSLSTTPKATTPLDKLTSDSNRYRTTTPRSLTRATSGTPPVTQVSSPKSNARSLGHLPSSVPRSPGASVSRFSYDSNSDSAGEDNPWHVVKTRRGRRTGSRGATPASQSYHQQRRSVR